MMTNEELRRLQHVELLLRFEDGGDPEVAVVEFKKEFELFLLNVRHFHEAHQRGAGGSRACAVAVTARAGMAERRRAGQVALE